MKKLTKELSAKTIIELEKEGLQLSEEITRLLLEAKVNPQKDTNLSFKKRKRLAAIMTARTEKIFMEKIKKHTK